MFFKYVKSWLQYSVYLLNLLFALKKNLPIFDERNFEQTESFV